MAPYTQDVSNHQDDITYLAVAEVGDSPKNRIHFAIVVGEHWDVHGT